MLFQFLFSFLPLSRSFITCIPLVYLTTFFFSVFFFAIFRVSLSIYPNSASILPSFPSALSLTLTIQTVIFPSSALLPHLNTCSRIFNTLNWVYLLVKLAPLTSPPTERDTLVVLTMQSLLPIDYAFDFTFANPFTVWGSVQYLHNETKVESLFVFLTDHQTAMPLDKCMSKWWELATNRLAEDWPKTEDVYRVRRRSGQEYWKTFMRRGKEMC